MLPFATFIDTRGLEHCWESHRTLLRKFFHPNFLARAPALQSVALGGQLADPKSGGFFYHNIFLHKIVLSNFF